MRNTLVHLAILFAVALAIKLAYVQERLQLPDIDHPILDSRFNDEYAKGIAFGNWTPDVARFQHEPYFRPPLYAYFVATVYRTFGTSPRILFTIQAMLGALTVVLMFCFCWLVFDRRVAWLAAALAVFYWPFTYHETERIYPALSLLLDMTFLLMAALAGRTGRLRYAVLTGTAVGLAAITRPTILITLPLAIWWLFRRQPDHRKQRLSLLIASAIIVIAPVTIRNWIRGHDFVPVASQGGVNFYIGNNPYSDGVRAVVPGTRADWWGGFHDTKDLAEREAGRPLRPSQVSSYWYRQGIEFLIERPGTAARLYARKAGLMLGNAEPSNERQLYFRKSHSRVLSFLVINFAFVLSAAVVGIVDVIRFTPRRKRKRVPDDGVLALLLAASYAVGVIVFFVNSRFRLPVVLFLIPLSAAGCVLLFDLARQEAWKRLAEVALIGGIVFTASLANPFGIGELADSRGEYAQGVDHFRNGDYALSIASFDRSLKSDPAYAPAWAMRGRAFGRSNQPARAINDLKKACELDSSFSDAFYWLGYEYQKNGDHARAGPLYSRCIELNPTHIYALTNLADVYFRQGRDDSARAKLERALALDSTYVNALYGMGYYWERAGEFDRAAAAYRRALPFEPARQGLARLARAPVLKDSLP